jgi:hypothetical protein
LPIPSACGRSRSEVAKLGGVPIAGRPEKNGPRSPEPGYRGHICRPGSAGARPAGISRSSIAACRGGEDDRAVCGDSGRPPRGGPSSARHAHSSRRPSQIQPSDKGSFDWRRARRLWGPGKTTHWIVSHALPLSYAPVDRGGRSRTDDNGDTGFRPAVFQTGPSYPGTQPSGPAPETWIKSGAGGAAPWWILTLRESNPRCARRDSNPHSAGSEPATSTGWVTCADTTSAE